MSANPVDTGRKLNVHKTFRRRPGCLLNVLCTFNLRSVSTGKLMFGREYRIPVDTFLGCATEKAEQMS